MSINLFTYNISNQGLEDDVDTALQAIASGKQGCYMVCANLHSLVVARKDKFFSESLKNADILLPDGSSIIFAAKVLNLPLSEKVSGTDFFLAFSQKANKKKGINFFFLGSSEKVLDLIKQKMERDYSDIEVCGTYSPPFKPEFSQEDNTVMVHAVNQAKPDVLWVGLTAPKQEKWIYENKDKLEVSFIGAIGAVFDFYAGTKKRSSDFWVKMGIEWLHRFLREPKRLSQRVFKSMPIFLSWIIKEKLKKYRSVSG